MCKFMRFAWLVALVGLLTVSVAVPDVHAQARLGIGNFNSSNNNQDNDDDDDDDDRQQGTQGQSGTQAFPFQHSGSNQRNQSSQQQPSGIDFSQGGQGGQGIQQFGNWQGSRKIGSFSQQYQTGSQPFSADWFKQHPQTFQADVSNTRSWNTANASGVTAWLGWGALQQGQQGQQGQISVGSSGVRMNQGQMNFRGYGRWYPLGVFTLLSGPGDQGTRMVQLAVDREGNVRGVYYDLITNSTHNVSGSIRRGDPPRVSWSLNSNKFLTFRASLYQLLEPYGTVTVRLPGGSQKWQIVRMEY